MNDLERTRQTVTVLDLLDQSHRAHAEDRNEDFDRLAREVCELDVDAVSIITGGMRIGEIPSPERDPQAWAGFLASNRDRLAELETAAAAVTEPETTTPAPLYGLRCGDPNHGGFGQVYVKSQGRHQIERLAASNLCYDIAVSRDGGKTWEAADA